jgi:adenosylmethionine-8-amino-7-oxononanoate aminotransferase
MSVSSRGLFTEAFTDFLFDIVFIETPDAGNLEKTISVIRSNNHRIAAFIYEPLLQAAGGMKIHEPHYLNRLLAFVQSEKILCIADEVLTGFGRTGSLFASETLSYPADMICLSKGLTGGTMALGATACSGAVFEAFLSDDHSRTFFHGHSYTANPLACVAGLASLDLLLEKSCLHRIAEIERQHRQFVKNELFSDKNEAFRNIRILGTVLAFELNTGTDGYVNLIGAKIMRRALNQGIYMRPLGNTVYIMPPYCISPEQLRKIYDFILSLGQSS